MENCGSFLFKTLKKHAKIFFSKNAIDEKQKSYYSKTKDKK